MKRKLLIALGVVALMVFGAAAWMFGPALLPPKNVEAGIARGDKVPVNLALLDSAGKPTTLADHMGMHGMVLVMVRSADWCPFCRLQLRHAKDIQGSLSRHGLSLASLSYDAPDKLRAFVASEEIGYAMLSDKNSRLIDVLGLRDPQYAPDSFAYGVPRASVLVLGPDGTVREKFVANDYRSRPTNEMVLEMAKMAVSAQ